MIEVKNQFARHMIMWVLTIPFIASFLMPAMFPLESMKIPATEHETLQILGQDPDAITKRANVVFTNLFIETGAHAFSERLFKSRKSAISKEGESNFVRKSNNYLEGFWNLIYKAIWRFMGMWPVLSVLLLAFVVPALVDGVVARETKIDQFKPHNPVFFWGAAHSVIMTIGAFLFLPFLPIPISIAVLYGAVALVAIGLWTTAANLQIGT